MRCWSPLTSTRCEPDRLVSVHPSASVPPAPAPPWPWQHRRAGLRQNRRRRVDHRDALAVGLHWQDSHGLIGVSRGTFGIIVLNKRRTAELTEQSWSGTVRFADGPRATIGEALGDIPTLPTGAGHDAGVLAAAVPTAMLFVRNPTGISHAPEEFASAEDCAAGVDALETALRNLAGQVAEGRS